jgi:hypothetical protein
LNECRQRRCAVADEASGDLSVEDRPKASSARQLENIEVLLGSVENHQSVVVEERCNNVEVDRGGVDEKDLPFDIDLDERQLGKVRALTMKLGVEAVRLD